MEVCNMRAKRVDANQMEIVKFLRSIGASVCNISSFGEGAPDLIVGLFGKNFLWEVKDGKKFKSQQKLTPAEEKFHLGWKGQVCIIRSIDDALRFIKDN